MTETKKSYQVRVTTADGQSLIWRKIKGGPPALLPEELIDTWISKFRPDIWEITAGGEMVGVGRSSEPSFKIAKVEKLPA
jgi:hypothetical protein